MPFSLKSWLGCFCLAVSVGQLFPVAAPAANADAEARRLLNTQGCKACHPFESSGESLAPDLSTVGSRLSAEQIRGWLVSVDHRHASGRIADFSHLRSDEIEALVTFLSQRR